MDVYKFLYEKEKEEFSYLKLAKILDVQWQTVENVLDELEKLGHVKLSKMERFPFKRTANLTEGGRKFASELFAIDESEIGLSEKLLLIIFYAVGGEIKGTTKLEKLPFLLERDFGVKLGDIIQYFPYLYGPYSIDVMQSINVLVYHRLVDIDEKVYISEVEGDRERIYRIHTLTPKGEDLAKSLFQRLPSELKERLVKLRVHAKKTTSELLKYVYTKYPKFKKYTKLDILKE